MRLDAFQRVAARRMDRLREALITRRAPRGGLAGFVARLHRQAPRPAGEQPARRGPASARVFAATMLSRMPSSPPRAVRGLYLWGGVGRGKTHLMNALHASLPFEERRRVHFHSFMQRIHEDLAHLQRRQDPLALVADGIAREALVVCLDEFHVSDITDAMLLARLLEALFEREVTLVATSNLHPDDLYREGLQRERFLPAIESIKSHMEVVHLDGDIDYRLRTLEHASRYHAPLDDAARISLAASFRDLAGRGATEGGALEIHHRAVPVVQRGDGVVWLEFDDICAGPRSAADYIELARRFHTVLVSNVRCLDDEENDTALRFIALVDELYDRNVNLIVSAQAEPGSLYLGRRLAPQFRRTRSRLEEMRSREYLGRPHLP